MFRTQREKLSINADPLFLSTHKSKSSHLVFGTDTVSIFSLSSISSSTIFASSSLRQAPATPIITATYIAKYSASGASSKNLLTFSLVKTLDFFVSYLTDFLFKKAIKSKLRYYINIMIYI